MGDRKRDLEMGKRAVEENMRGGGREGGEENI